MIDFNALLDEAQTQQDAGYELALTATFLGIPEEKRFAAHVRRLSMNDPSWVETVPTHLRAEINKALTEVGRLQKKAQAQGNREPATLEERVKDNPIVLRGADAFCVAAFIEPRLYLGRNDDHDPGDVWVGKIHADDRMDAFMAAINADSEAAKKLTVFRGRAEPAAHAGSTGPVAAEPVRGAAPHHDEGLDGIVPVPVRSNGAGFLERV
jgi:hypothetical protein